MGAMLSGHATPFLQDNGRYHRKAVSYSFLAGMLFGVGWLIVADATLWSGVLSQPGGAKLFLVNISPLLGASVFVFMLNILNYDEFRQSRYSYGLGPRKLWVEAWVWMSSIVGVLAAIGVLALLVLTKVLKPIQNDTWLAGTAVVGTLFILVSGVVFWVGRGHATSTL